MVFIGKWSSVCTTVLLTSTWASAASVPDWLESSPNPLTKRSLPTFVNFEDAASRQAQITQAFKDMETMVNACLNGDANIYNEVYSHWFPAANRQDMRNILNAMVNRSSTDGTGSTTLSQITADDKDHYEACTATVAYVVNSSPADRENPAVPVSIHFCHSETRNAFALPALGEVECPNLDTFLSTKMQTLGGYALVHELAHVAQISGPIIQPLNIPLPEQPNTLSTFVVDVKYDPQSCQTLLSTASQDTVVNADSYGWFITELYWTLQCNRPFGPPQSNLKAPITVADESKDPYSLR